MCRCGGYGNWRQLARRKMKTVLLVSLLTLCACSSNSSQSSHEEQLSDKVIGPAPAVFRVQFDTSKGPFVIEAHRTWAPYGADRFYELVQKKFFDDTRFFRVVKGFVVQFGISGYPDVAAHWRTKTIPDDPVKEPNARGTVVFATAGPNTRTTQLFINLVDNTMLDSRGFSPFGRVVDDGMKVVDQIDSEY